MRQHEFHQKTSHKLNEVDHKIQLIEYEMKYMGEPLQQLTDQSIGRIRFWHQEIRHISEIMGQFDLKSWFEQVQKIECLWQNIQKEFVHILVNLPDVGTRSVED